MSKKRGLKLILLLCLILILIGIYFYQDKFNSLVNNSSSDSDKSDDEEVVNDINYGKMSKELISEDSSYKIYMYSEYSTVDVSYVYTAYDIKREKYLEDYLELNNSVIYDIKNIDNNYYALSYKNGITYIYDIVLGKMIKSVNGLCSDNGNGNYYCKNKNITSELSNDNIWSVTLQKNNLYANCDSMSLYNNLITVCDKNICSLLDLNSEVISLNMKFSNVVGIGYGLIFSYDNSYLKIYDDSGNLLYTSERVEKITKVLFYENEDSSITIKGINDTNNLNFENIRLIYNLKIKTFLEQEI